MSLKNLHLPWKAYTDAYPLLSHSAEASLLIRQTQLKLLSKRLEIRSLKDPSTPISIQEHGAGGFTFGNRTSQIYWDPELSLGIGALCLAHEMCHANDEVYLRYLSSLKGPSGDFTPEIEAEKKAYDLTYLIMTELKENSPDFVRYLDSLSSLPRILQGPISREEIELAYQRIA